MYRQICMIKIKLSLGQQEFKTFRFMPGGWIHYMLYLITLPIYKFIQSYINPFIINKVASYTVQFLALRFWIKVF